MARSDRRWAARRGAALAFIAASVLGASDALGQDPAAPQASTEQAPAPKREVGLASWYGGEKHGQRTASGERFDQGALTAAHPSLPFDTKVRVTNLRNGRKVAVRITDRSAPGTGRVIDLSRRAAAAIGLKRAGLGRVSVEPITEEQWRREQGGAKRLPVTSRPPS